MNESQLSAAANSVAPTTSDARVAAEVRRCASLPPGPQLIHALTAVDVRRLNTTDRLHVAVAWQAAANWISAQNHLAVAAVAGPLARSVATANGDADSLTGDEVDDIVCAEIGAALGLSPLTAADFVARSRAAATFLSPIAGRMLAGDWGEAHLRRAVDVCSGASPDVAHDAARAVAESAPACTPSQLRGRLQRQLVKRDPEAVRRRTRAARRDRGTTLWADPDLRARLDIHGHWSALARAHHHFDEWAHQRQDALRELRRTVPDVRLCCPDTIRSALAAAAPQDQTSAVPRHTDGPCRWCGAEGAHFPTVDELRADAVVEAAELLARATADPSGESRPEAATLNPRRGRRWSHAVVVVDLATALGLAQEPGWVPGYGHVPAAVARELACTASHWQRFLLDDDSKLLSTGRFTYRPSDRLRELVTARDLTCTFPGCHRPATDADLDHRVNFDGTNTTAANLHPLCRTHHRLKTHAGWTVRRAADGHDTWVSPLGRTYSQTPHNPWLPSDDDTAVRSTEDVPGPASTKPDEPGQDPPGD